MKGWPLFFLVFSVAAVLVLTSSGQNLAYAKGPVSVKGRVVNGTQGGTVAPGLAVFLHVFSEESVKVTSLEAATDEAGAFQFDEVNLAGSFGYALTMDYAGMRYSKLIGFEDVAGPIELMVYETTQDLSVVRVEHQALVVTGVDEVEQQVAAVEFVSLSNDSDRTLLPDLSNVGQGQFSFLRFSLPPGASEFDIQSDLVGGEVIPVGTGFGLTTPVTPGEHTISFSYKFPYRESTFSYRQSLLQGADLYQVLVPQRLGPLHVSSLEAVSPLEVEGIAYRVWEGQDIAPGQGPVVEIANLPRPTLLGRLGRSVTSDSFWHLAIPITLGAALALVLVYAGLRAPRRAMAPSAAADPGETNGNTAQREALVRAIAVLDERFHQGQVSEAEYQAQRSRLKDRIEEASTPETTR